MSFPNDAQSIAREVGQLRKKWGALVVLVVRTNDISYSVAEDITPREVGAILNAEIAGVVQGLADRRDAAANARRDAARKGATR